MGRKIFFVIQCHACTETSEMCPNFKDQAHQGCRKIDLITEEKMKVDSCSLDFPSSSHPSTVSTMPESHLHNLLFKCRKVGRNSTTILSEQVPEITSRNGDCFSVVSSDAPLVPTKDQSFDPQVEHEIQVIQGPLLSPSLGNSKPHIPNRICLWVFSW